MNIRTRYSLVLLLALTVSGCVSTLPEEDGIKDPVLFEQTNLEIAYGFLQQGLPGRAIGRLEEILKLNSKSARTYGMLGVVYQTQGEYELAERNFRHSLDLDPSASDVRNNYGVLLYELKRYEDARIQFQKVTEDVYYQQRSRAFENLGFVELSEGNKDKAEQFFQRALRLDQNLPKASLELTEIYFEKGNYVEAEGFYQNYLRLIRFGRPDARSLLLGIRLARIFKNQKQQDQLSELLARYYPGSEEYRQYQALVRDD